MGLPVRRDRGDARQGDFEYGQLHARVLELEKKLDFLYRHLGVEYVGEVSNEDRAVVDALRSGGVLEAVRIYREIHNVDPLSAKQAVEVIRSRIGL